MVRIAIIRGGQTLCYAIQHRNHKISQIELLYCKQIYLLARICYMLQQNVHLLNFIKPSLLCFTLPLPEDDL